MISLRACRGIASIFGWDRRERWFRIMLTIIVLAARENADTLSLFSYHNKAQYFSEQYWALLCPGYQTANANGDQSSRRWWQGNVTWTLNLLLRKYSFELKTPNRHWKQWMNLWLSRALQALEYADMRRQEWYRPCSYFRASAYGTARAQCFMPCRQSRSSNELKHPTLKRGTEEEICKAFIDHCDGPTIASFLVMVFSPFTTLLLKHRHYVLWSSKAFHLWSPQCYWVRIFAWERAIYAALYVHVLLFQNWAQLVQFTTQQPCRGHTFSLCCIQNSKKAVACPTNEAGALMMFRPDRLRCLAKDNESVWSAKIYVSWNVWFLSRITFTIVLQCVYTLRRTYIYVFVLWLNHGVHDLVECWYLL